MNDFLESQILKLCHEVLEAASYRIGRRNNRNTTSGFMGTMGIEGIRPKVIPTTTSKMGLGSFSRSITASTARRMAKYHYYDLKHSS
jgi:hypothetical protein